MPRELSFDGVLLHANATPCAYHCRYCQLRSARTDAVPFERFDALVRRFIAWREAQDRPDFGIHPWYGNAYEHDLPTLRGMMALDRALGHHHEVLLMGGLAHRSQPEMRQWLDSRRTLGIGTLVATFSGQGPVHDHWNHQPGNYRFQIDSLRLAAEMGMRLQQRILLLRSNLATLEGLLDDLEAIGSPADRVQRWAIPLFYSGRARALEDERLTEADFAGLSLRLRALLRDDAPGWRSERAWAEHVERAVGDGPQTVSLRVDMSPAGLDWAEARGCDEILDTLQQRYRTAARQLPSRSALCARQADRSNTRVYFNLPQMERLWMDRYLATHPGHQAAAQLLWA